MTATEAALRDRAMKGAYAAGQRAFYSRKPNPYPVGTDEHAAWTSGYDAELAEDMSETARLDAITAGYAP